MLYNLNCILRASSMAEVRFDGMLRQFGARGPVSEEASDVRNMLERMEERFPRLRYRIRDETGRLRGNVRLFVNGTDIAALKGLDTPLAHEDEVDILHSIQGG